MNLTVLVAPVASVALLFGSIGVATLTGDWVTSGRQQVVAGQALTVDDLKGWMTLQQAADGLGLPVGSLIALVGAPDGVLTPATAFKDVEGLVPGFELTAFRDQLTALLAGGAAASAEPSATPQPAPAPTPTHTPSPASGSTQSVTGQSTLTQVATAAGVDVADLVRESGLPADVDVDRTLKDLRDTIPGFEIQQVRDALTRLG